MAQDKRISSLPQPMLEEIIRIVKETMVDESILARLTSGDGYQKDPAIGSGGGGSTTYAALTDAAKVDLPTVNTPLAGALAKRVAAVNASPVVPGGVTTLTRTPVTTVGAEAPNGYYNRPLASDHSLTVDVTGAVVNDAIMVFNTSAVSITLTAGGLVVPIAAGKTAELLYNGTAFVDGTPAGGSYTDEQVRDAVAAMFAAGTHTGITFTNDDANDRASLNVTVTGNGGVSALAPTSKNTVPVSTNRGILAQFDVPANALGAGGEIDFDWEAEKSGTTDALAYVAYFGAAGSTLAANVANEIMLIGQVAATQEVSFQLGVRAYNGTLRTFKNTGSGELQSGAVAALKTLAVDQAAGFTVWLCVSTSTTDTVACVGAHAVITKVA